MGARCESAIMRAAPVYGSTRPDGPGLQGSDGPRSTGSVATTRRLWRAFAIPIALAVVAGGGLGAWEWLAWRESRAAQRALACGRFQEARDAVERLHGLRLRRAEAHYLRAKTAIALGHRGEYVE